MTLVASVLHLDRTAIKALRITDLYSLHRVVYGLYPDVRSTEDKQASQTSGILWADREGDFQTRQILLLANREPAEQTEDGHGDVQSKPVPPDFLEHDRYRFQVIVNPTRRDNATRKLIPVKGRDAVTAWFSERATASWGFAPAPEHLQVDRIDVHHFRNKAGHPVTLAQAHVRGVLRVSDRDRFCHSFSHGIGRARSFGCGLLQIAPMQTPTSI